MNEEEVETSQRSHPRESCPKEKGSILRCLRDLAHTFVSPMLSTGHLHRAAVMPEPF